jgi:hypothetical protein
VLGCVVNSDQFDASAKTTTCILAPACFALGAEVFASYEGGLVGIQSGNVNLEANNFTYSACVGMMVFDAVLYGVLAWYLDNVLPSEFGAPLPYYFPFLPSYWCGAPASTRANANSSTTAGASTVGSWYLGCLVALGLAVPRRRYSDVEFDSETEDQSQGLVKGAGAGPALTVALIGADDGVSGGGGGANNAARVLSSESAGEGRGGQVVGGGVNSSSGGGGGAFMEAVSADLRRQEGQLTCLSIQGLRKVFQSAAGGDDRVAVDRLNLNLYQGHVTVLLGHNGAGALAAASSSCFFLLLLVLLASSLFNVYMCFLLLFLFTFSSLFANKICFHILCGLCNYTNLQSLPLLLLLLPSQVRPPRSACW